MPTIDPTTLKPYDLAPMLRAWAGGFHPSEAAVGLLIAHDRWLRRRDFLDRLIDAVDDGWGPRGAIVPMAAVDWEAVPEFATQVPASSSELAVLKLAASLAGTGSASLLELTTSLDDDNGRHFLDALAHQFGWHERGTTHLVTGRQRGETGRIPKGPDEPLPSFEELRVHAYRLLVDAADWLRSDYRPGTGPSGAVADAVRQAFGAIGAAKNALSDAAHEQTRSLARHRAEADSAQYPDVHSG